MNTPTYHISEISFSGNYFFEVRIFRYFLVVSATTLLLCSKCCRNYSRAETIRENTVYSSTSIQQIRCHRYVRPAIPCSYLDLIEQNALALQWPSSVECLKFMGCPCTVTFFLDIYFSNFEKYVLP